MNDNIIGITLHCWNAKNNGGDLLKVFTTSTKDIKIASAKVKALYKENACFVYLEYAGTKEV